MPDDSRVLHGVQDGVAVLTVNEPEKMNPLRGGTYRVVEDRLGKIRGDDSIDGLVITFTGRYMAGANVPLLAKLICEGDGCGVQARSRTAIEAGLRLENSGKPVVFASAGEVKDDTPKGGELYGGAFEMAMACHGLVCAKNTKRAATLSEVRLGIVPGAAGALRLIRRVYAWWIRKGVGHEKALQKAIEASWRIRLAKPFSSDELLEHGIASDVVPVADVLPRAIQLVHELKAGTSGSLPLYTDPIPGFPEIFAPLPTDAPFSTQVDSVLQMILALNGTNDFSSSLVLQRIMWRMLVQCEDAGIGLEHFIKHKGKGGPAPFVHLPKAE